MNARQVAALVLQLAQARQTIEELVAAQDARVDQTLVQLKQRANQTSLELRAAELCIERDLANAATQAKSEFLARMSHEIRTPINGVIGMTDLLLDTQLTLEQRDYLETAQSSAGELLGVIDDILDFSKIEARKLKLETLELDLRASLGSAVRGLAHRAHSKGIALILSVSPSVPAIVVGDPVRLKQIVINLVGNAVKFTDQGEIVVRVQLVSREKKSALIHFTVQDTGIGVPHDKQGLIFHAFDQADSSTSRLYAGTGLGLAITSQLVTMMGGAISVESEPGRGSTFAFTLRLPVAVDSRSLQPPSQNGTRVLIVDPSMTSRDVLLEQLTGWRFLPTAVPDVASALVALDVARLAGSAFELVLLDDLAQGATTEAAHLLAANGGAVLAMCVMGGRTLLDDAGDRMARVTKPPTPSALLDAIEGLLQVGRAPLERPRPAPAARQTRAWRVLVADDNAVNRKVATIVLERGGHNVTTATDGRAAINLVAREHFDVVLMDVQMPGLNGCEATQIIRAKELETGRHLIIIAVTAQAMTGHAEQCIEAGMDGYVSKPLHAATLFDTIDHLITKWAPREAPPAAA